MTSEYCPKRRTFLKALAALGGGAAVMPAAAKSEKRGSTTDSGTKATTSRGYEETEHIRKYYRSAAL